MHNDYKEEFPFIFQLEEFPIIYRSPWHWIGFIALCPPTSDWYNLTWALEKYRTQYHHWLIELNRKLNLPIFEGMALEILKMNEARMADVQHKKSETYKNRRMQLKVSIYSRVEWS